MAVLYRKYRPQAFADVVGQAHVTRTLAAAIAAGRVAHAYLFSGPRGVGKTTTARLLAKAVNCERRTEGLKNGEQPHRTGGSSKVFRSSVLRSSVQAEVPCNACDLCTEITEGRCLDVIEMDAASHTGVDHVREHVIDVVRLAPARTRRRVFIIDEVHMLSASAFNALLKTIEEPPDHALFILATTELHRVPETVRSRCQHFAFRRVAAEDLARRLRELAAAEGVTVDDAVCAAIARAADGSVRDAESMLGQLLALGGDRIGAADASLVLPRSSRAHAAALVDAIVRRDAAAVLGNVRSAEEEGFDAEAYIRDVIAVLRDAIAADVHDAARVAERVAALRVFAALLDQIGRSDHPFFALEVAALSCIASGGGSSGPPPHRQRAQERAVAEPATAPSVTESASDSARTASATPPERTSGAEDHDVLTRLRQVWGTLITRIADANAALPYLLEGGRPQRIIDGVLTIGFRYKLHAEKVKQTEPSNAIADAVHALLGTKLRIATAVIGIEEFQQLDAASRPQTGDTVADAALEVFGGRVVH